MAARNDPDIARLLGVSPGNGAALGLDEAWARHVIADVGNYGEVFERNLGMATPIAHGARAQRPVDDGAAYCSHHP